MAVLPTVVHRFWHRAFNEPSRPAFKIKNPETEPIVVRAGQYPHVVYPPSHLSLNYESAGMATSAIAALLNQGGFKRGDRAAILAWNCVEWVLADLAIQSLGGITVPIYPHSTPEQVNYVLRDSGATFVFSNETSQLEKVSPEADATPVLFNDIPEHLTGIAQDPSVDFVHNFLTLNMQEDCAGLWCAARAQMRWFDVAHKENSFAFASEDIATIIYTSGSTGVPKGVVLTHTAFAAACQGIISHGFELDPARDVYLSYLPLAHVYERAAGTMLCLWAGVPIAFCSVDEVGDALKVIRPTLFHGVPAVWRRVKEKIDGNLSSATGLKKKLITWAFAQEEGSFGAKVADALVFRKIRSELGGKLRICTSGGAAISPEILHFYKRIGIDVLQGYGLTETTGASAVSRPDGVNNKIGTVGPVLPNVEMRIQDGEIQFRGPTVMQSYWNRPEETASSFTEDGWFKTGDKGELDADGNLSITGRIKRLLKTDGGKYVSPEKIEKVFESEPLIQYIVPVGDGKPYIGALIFVNRQSAANYLNGDVDVATHPAILQAMEAAIAKGNESLERWETIKKWLILPVEATVENGLLTPTLKIRTEEVLQRFAADVDRLYIKT